MAVCGDVRVLWIERRVRRGRNLGRSASSPEAVPSAMYRGRERVYSRIRMAASMSPRNSGQGRDKERVYPNKEIDTRGNGG